MAKELQPIERQVFTPQVAVKTNQAYATMGEATSELGTLIANTLQDQAVYYSGVAGEQQALEGTAPKTLAPPITKATAAYNKAVLNTEARQLANQGREMIMQTYTELSNPATFNYQTPAEFNARVTGISQGILDNTRPENRALVQAQLDELAVNAKIKMLDNSISYDNAQTENNFNNELFKAQQQLREAVLTKDANQIAAAKLNIGNILDDYAQINQGIMNKLPEITRKLNDQLKTDQVVADYLQAYSQGNASAQQFITDLATRKIEGLTTEEQLTATAEVLKIHAQNQRLTNAYETEVFQGMALKINADQVGSIEQIQQEVGGKLDAADVFRLQSAWITHNRSKNKANASVGIVLNARKKGPQEVAKLSSTVLNEAYEQMVAEGVAAYNSSLAPDQPRINDLSLTQKMQNIVAPIGAPIKDFQIELSYGLKSNNPAVAMDALQAYKYGWENRETFGDVLKGLDSEADQIAQFALSTSSKSEVDQMDLIAQAQQNIKDTSDTTREARQKRLDGFYTMNAGVAEIDKYYKASFGVTPGQAQFDASFGAFQRLFDTYFMGVANGDANVAMKMAQAQMRDWGTSKWGEPDDIMYTPIEKAVSFSELGYWLPNQVGLALNKVLKNHEEQKTGIKRPEWMAKQAPTGDVSEKDLMEKNYFSTTREAAPRPGSAGSLFVTDDMLNREGLFERELTAIVDGVERRIYITSTNNTRQSASGEAVYQFYYKDDFGVAQFLEDPYNPLGAAQFSVQSLGVMLPEVYDEMRSETFDQIAADYARAEFANKNKADGVINTIGDFLGRNLVPGYRINQDINELIYMRDNKERIKKEFLDKEQSARELARKKKEQQIKFEDGKVVQEDLNAEEDNG